MFNKIKLLACSLEIHVYASVSKSAESCWHHCQQDSTLFDTEAYIKQAKSLILLNIPSF